MNIELLTEDDFVKSKEELINEVVYSSTSDRNYRAGGQHCGMPHYKIIAEQPMLDIKIECAALRSMISNRELVKQLMELAIDEYLSQFK